MSITNYVMILVGVGVAILGILALFIPQLTKIISLPGSPRMKALISVIVGLIFLLIGLFIELPVNS